MQLSRDSGIDIIHPSDATTLQSLGGNPEANNEILHPIAN